MSQLIRIAAEVIGRPLLLHPSKVEVILSILDSRIGVDAEAVLNDPEMSRFTGSRRRETRPEGGLARASNGVALITIDGSLVNRGAWLDSSSGMVSYEGIGAQIKDAATDPEIQSIVLDLNTPGGQAGGMFALADLVRKVSAEKPVVAMVNDLAASAGYGLAAGAREIVVSPSSTVGSIGVVYVHVDRSREMEAKGQRPTIIHAGAHKVDGHPFGPLPDAVRADLQADIGKIYDLFLDSVAAGRGRRLSRKAARETEARTFMGAEAIERGLADRMATLDEVIADLGRPRRTRPTPAPLKGTTMDAESRTSVQASTSRIEEIVTCGHAKQFPSLAHFLAFATALPVGQAHSVLAAAAADLANPRQMSPQSAGLFEIRQSPETISAGWRRAIATANQRFS